MKPPTRILDDRLANPDLASDLEVYSRTTYAYDDAAGWEALQRSIADAPALPEASTKLEALGKTAAGAPRALALKVAATSLVVATAAGWFAIANPFGRTPAPSPTPPSAAIPSKSADPSPALPPSASSSPRALPVPEAAPMAASDVPDRASPPPRHRAADDDVSQLRREITQLARIRELLATDPQRALRLAEAGHREFGAGTLYQEREALALIALWSLGNEGAELRTRSFVARFPRSPFRSRIEALQSKAMGKP